MFRLLLGLFDRCLAQLIDAVVWLEPPEPEQPTEPLPCLRCRCPICGTDVVMTKPHTHGVFYVEVTDWPQPGVLATIDPEWVDAA